jgi:hypothetical protein
LPLSSLEAIVRSNSMSVVWAMSPRSHPTRKP